MTSYLLRLLLFLVLSTGCLWSQYRTETWGLEGGWNAIYLNLDLDNESFDTLLATQPEIIEIWQWLPDELDPSLTSPEVIEPAAADRGVGEFRVWLRDDPTNSTFSIPRPNTAYLVNVDDKNGTTLSLKGKVIAPRVKWRIDGLNLVGFPSSTAGPQALSSYLAGSGILDDNPGISQYVGGKMDQNNPAPKPADEIQMTRGEALWIPSDQFSNSYGPVSVEVALDTGLHFGPSGSLKRLVLRNQTDAEISVTINPVTSESAPGDTTPPSAPSLLTRERDANTGLFNYTPLGAGKTVAIPARGDLGISLSVDRESMSGNPGDAFVGLLRITDGAGLTEIYLPITAEKASLAGLWVGEARITKVQNQLYRFQRDDDGNYKVDENGEYIPEPGGTDRGVNDTAQEFKLRLLLHVDAAGVTTILSRAYAGVISDDGAGNVVTGITTAESLLVAEHLKTAVRLSCTHLPTDFVQEMSGTLAPGIDLTTNVILGPNHPSNPFLHTYHPDHDNKDARFDQFLSEGIESHRVKRAMTLSVNAAAAPGEGPQWGTSLLSGTFSEKITGIHKKPITNTGIFALGKVSSIPVLQTP